MANAIFLVLVSGWSDNGWLSGGHAVRMAMEICKQSRLDRPGSSELILGFVPCSRFIAMHKAWPDLFKRMQQNKIGTTIKDRQLVISARTWFCLYLFEHQYVLSRPSSEYEMS